MFAVSGKMSSRSPNGLVAGAGTINPAALNSAGKAFVYYNHPSIRPSIHPLYSFISASVHLDSLRDELLLLIPYCINGWMISLLRRGLPSVTASGVKFEPSAARLLPIAHHHHHHHLFPTNTSSRNHFFLMSFSSNCFIG